MIIGHGLSHQTIRRLIYFAAIAEAGSIRQAAIGLGLSVQVVSEALRVLEDELGVTLATRSTRHFALTDSGRRVAGEAAEIIARLESLGARHETGPITGPLSITLPVELAATWMVPTMAQFLKAHPKVEPKINVDDQLHALDHGPVELAIRTKFHPPGQWTKGPPALFPLTLVSKTSCQMTAVPEGLMIESTIIDGRAIPNIQALDPATGETMPVLFRKTIEINNRDAALSFVRGGLGMALVLRQSVAQDISDQTLIEVLPGDDFGAVEAVPVFRDRLPSRAAVAFAGFVTRRS